MTTQVYLAGLSTQGTNQLPFGFDKKREPTVASCKTKHQEKE